MTDTHTAAAYLDDLARMLSDVEPGARDEVLAGVREHLEATLAEHPDDPHALDAALLRLGPPERVAAAARADLGVAPAAAPSPPPHPAARRHPRRTRVAATVSLALLALPVLLALVARVVIEVVGSGHAELLGGAGLWPHVTEALALLPVLFVPWLVAVVVAVVGPTPTGRTKAWLVLLGPAASLAVLVATLLGDPGSFGTPASLIPLAAVAVGLARTGRQAWRETAA